MDATTSICLGLVRVEIDGRVLYPEATLILSGDAPLEEPPSFPPPKRPSKPRPAPQLAPSLKSIYQRFVGYGR